MSRIFITGSTDGLGRAAARGLLNDGHQVVLHARSQDRTLAFGDLASRSAGVAVGDLSSGVETRCIADEGERCIEGLPEGLQGRFCLCSKSVICYTSNPLPAGLPALPSGALFERAQA